jgi:hypothetical protein
MYTSDTEPQVRFSIEASVPFALATSFADALTGNNDDIILAGETAMRKRLDAVGAIESIELSPEPLTRSRPTTRSKTGVPGANKASWHAERYLGRGPGPLDGAGALAPPAEERRHTPATAGASPYASRALPIRSYKRGHL